LRYKPDRDRQFFARPFIDPILEESSWSDALALIYIIPYPLGVLE
jgi:hypothetical protein